MVYRCKACSGRYLDAGLERAENCPWCGADLKQKGGLKKDGRDGRRKVLLHRVQGRGGGV